MNEADDPTGSGPMDWRLADTDPNTARVLWPHLPKRESDARSAPENYKASRDLLEAMDTAISVGQPLVLTGEPGVGKTAFGEYVAYRLGLPEIRPRKRVLRYDVKSTTQGRDLLYRYEALDHFNAANIRKEEVSAKQFVTFEPLGEAILRTIKPAQVDKLIGRKLPQHKEPIRSVVLIDEIDKAPRDVPNDLLREIEDMEFRVPEFGAGVEVSGEPGLRPVVIITSNRETRLPDAFMRRCCFFHIPFPPEGLLGEIVENRINELPKSSDLVSDAIRLIIELRTEVEGRGRPPGVAELLAFLEDLKSRGYGPRHRLDPSKDDWKRAATAIFLEGDQDDPDRVAAAAARLANNAGAG